MLVVENWGIKKRQRKTANLPFLVVKVLILARLIKKGHLITWIPLSLLLLLKISATNNIVL